MRRASSKERLSQMHEALDRQLEQINAPPRSSSASRRDREELRYFSNIDDPRRAPALAPAPIPAPSKPAVFDHMVRDSDIRTKKNEIGDLQRKLKELERKMGDIDLSSEEENDGRQRASLAFREQKETPLHPNEDTARFLLEASKEREKASNKFMYSYPSLEDEEEEDENSDEDFAEVQRAIEKKKQEVREQAGRRTVNTVIAKTNLPKPAHEPPRVDPERKVSTEVESVLKPKYSNEKTKAKPSQQKKPIRDSVTSKKSLQKQQQPQLNRANSKRSIKSSHSNANSLRRSRQNSRQRQRQDRSFDRFSEKQQCLHSQQVGLARDLKRMGNLQREAAHYKRLAKKYKEQLDEYRVMEIELKELRKNFAKSELIRTQQKKVIETLKSKMPK